MKKILVFYAGLCPRQVHKACQDIQLTLSVLGWSVIEVLADTDEGEDGFLEL